MRFFIDTANVDDIRKANDMGVICGVTTNPSLIAKEGRDFNEVIKEITSIVDGPISGEVKATTTDAEGMIKQGNTFYFNGKQKLDCDMITVLRAKPEAFRKDIVQGIDFWHVYNSIPKSEKEGTWTL